MPETGLPVAGGANAASAGVTLRELHFSRAWNLRGDPAEQPFVAHIEAFLGLPLPVEPNTTAAGGHGALLWLGPRSWLWIADRSGSLGFDETRLALNAVRAALFDVSASYVGWCISGPAVVRVLNRMCPLDLHSCAFPAGHCAQSLLGHVGALLYKPADDSGFIVLVARSLAADAWGHLCASAAAEGYVVGPSAPLGTTY